MNGRATSRIPLAAMLGSVLVLGSLTPGYGQAPVKETREQLAERVYTRLHGLTTGAIVSPPAASASVFEQVDAARAERLYLWSRRWMEAVRDASTTKEQRIAALRAHLSRMKAWEEASPVKKALKEAGNAGPDLDTSPGSEWARSEFATSMKYFRLEAESWLAEPGN